MSENILRIVTDADGGDPCATSAVRVLLGEAAIPYISKIELGVDGCGLVAGDFVAARITVAVKLGR